MTQQPPWYGGNKIPDSYLKKFLSPTPREEQDIPYELRVFLDNLGAFKKNDT